MLAFELVQTGLVTGVAFEIFVYNYGDTNSLTEIYYAWFFVAVMCAIVSVTVQSFFAWRIYVLARSIAIASVIVLVRGTVCLKLAPPERCRWVDFSPTGERGNSTGSSGTQPSLASSQGLMDSPVAQRHAFDGRRHIIPSSRHCSERECSPFLTQWTLIDVVPVMGHR